MRLLNSLSGNVRASGFMVLAMSGFTCNDFLIKSLDGRLPNGQVMFIRGALLSALVAVLLWRLNAGHGVRLAARPIMVLRLAMELGATMAFLTALPLLPFSSTAAILQSLPLAVTLGAWVFLGEPIGWRRLLAIGVGFVGVLIIIQPGTDSFQPASLWVVAAVFFAVGRDLSTRRLPAEIPSLVVSFVTAIVVSLVGIGLSTIEAPWAMPDRTQWFTLAGSAVFLFIGYQFITLAMRSGEVAYVVPFRYTSLVWAMLLAYAFLHEVPSHTTLLGAGIVVSMGLFSLYREVQASRRQWPPGHVPGTHTASRD